MLTIANQVDVMNRLGRAMADSTRSRILLSLLERPGYPAQLARELELTRSNVSNHLSCLRGCGIVVAEPEGRQTRYEIADPHLAAALTALVTVTLAVGDRLPCVDPACTVSGCCDPAAGSAPAPVTADRGTGGSALGAGRFGRDPAAGTRAGSRAESQAGSRA